MCTPQRVPKLLPSSCLPIPIHQPSVIRSFVQADLALDGRLNADLPRCLAHGTWLSAHGFPVPGPVTRNEDSLYWRYQMQCSFVVNLAGIPGHVSRASSMFDMLGFPEQACCPTEMVTMPNGCRAPVASHGIECFAS